MDKKVLALVGAAGIAAGWLMNASVSQSPVPPTNPAGSARRDPRPLGSAAKEPPATYTEQLRLRLHEQPRSPSPGRNPFVFGSRRPAPSMASRASRTEARPEEQPPSPPAVPEGPRIQLSGIASNQANGATTWTAVIVDNGQLVFVSVGDKLSGGYTVTKVDETSAAVADAKGIEIVLRLK
jgi:hypothetical protein